MPLSLSEVPWKIEGNQRIFCAVRFLLNFENNLCSHNRTPPKSKTFVISLPYLRTHLTMDEATTFWNAPVVINTLDYWYATKCFWRLWKLHFWGNEMNTNNILSFENCDVMIYLLVIFLNPSFNKFCVIYFSEYPKQLQTEHLTAEALKIFLAHQYLF